MQVKNMHDVPHDPVSRWDSTRKMHKMRIYAWVKDETIIDNLMNRRNRPFREWRSAVEAAARDYCKNKGVAFTKLQWSQKAGCQCGCSPGFIADVTTNFDLFCDVTN